MKVLTQDDLHRQFNYNPISGLFTRIQSKKCHRVGNSPKSHDSKGYLLVYVNGKIYKAHRLAWFYMTGEWPKSQMDHINGIRDDNRWDNLREATGYQNQHNCGIKRTNTSGYKGVHWHSRQKAWSAGITANGMRKHLGFFKTPEEAYSAYCQAAKELHGEYAKVA